MAKKAIVMGATSGIGMEVAKLLAAKGWQVGIAGRRIERLQALISQGGITSYQQIDVTSPNAPAQLLELINKLGGMDLYFHSSGIGWQNNSLDIEKEMKTLETNGLGFTRMVDTAFNWFAAQSSTPTNKSELSGLKVRRRQTMPIRISALPASLPLPEPKVSVQPLPTLPPSDSRTIIWNACRSRHGCVISLSPSQISDQAS